MNYHHHIVLCQTCFFCHETGDFTPLDFWADAQRSTLAGGTTDEKVRKLEEIMNQGLVRDCALEEWMATCDACEAGGFGDYVAMKEGTE